MITKAAVRAYRSELRISGDRYTLNWLEKFVHRNDEEGGPNLKVRCRAALAARNHLPVVGAGGGGGVGGRGGGAYSNVVCLTVHSRLTVDHASFSRRCNGGGVGVGYGSRCVWWCWFK